MAQKTYTEKELQDKKQALRSKSVLTYANTINGAQLLLLARNRVNRKLQNAKYQLEHNTNGFYRSELISNKIIYRKQMEREKEQLESDLKSLEKQLDDLEDSF